MASSIRAIRSICRATALIPGKPFIASIKTDFSGDRYGQDKMADSFLKFTKEKWPEFPYEKQVRSIFKRAEIKNRTMHCDPAGLFVPPSFANHQLHQSKLRRLATKVTVKTASEVIADVGLKPRNLKIHTFHSSDSATPYYDVNINNALGMSETIRRDTLGSMGCVGGLAALWNGYEHLLSRSGGEALVSVSERWSRTWEAGMNGDYAKLLEQEKSSVTMPGGPEVKKQLSTIIGAAIPAALFGDGAASLMLFGPDHPLRDTIAARGNPIAHLIGFTSLMPKDTENMVNSGTTPSGSLFTVTVKLPDVVEQNVERLIGNLLTEHDLEMTDITRWIVHPGGSKILRIVEEKLKLMSWMEEVDVSDANKVNNLELYNYLSGNRTEQSVTRPSPPFKTFEENRQWWNQNHAPLRHAWESLRDNGNTGCVAVIDTMHRTNSCKINPPKRGEYGVAVAVGPGTTLQAALIQW
jgi:predicted naringenin-chalcone synthase